MLFWGPAPQGFAGLWYLKALAPCKHGCHTLVAAIWVEVTARHDIESVPVRPQRRVRRELKSETHG